MLNIKTGHRLRPALLLVIFFICIGAETAIAATFNIGIMQAQSGAAKKYAPLEAYLQKRDIHIKFIPLNSYTEAAARFEKGEVDGMFSGSGIAGVLLLKGLVNPLVRPVDTQGRSTYWAVVVGRKGDKPFTGSAAYFNGKKVAFSALASSGEFFFHAIPNIDRVDARTIVANNHQDALDKLNKGVADFAIVKNMVWDTLKGKYPALEQVGQDGGQNPNETLIVSKKTSPEDLKHILSVLLAVGSDPEAGAVRESMGIKGFMVTTTNDFTHTLTLLKRAGVTPQYDFR